MMKRNDLKTIIKPLVKECINEILIEEGLLSNIVSEVAVGLQGNLISEAQRTPTQSLRPSPQQDMAVKSKNSKKQINEYRKKLRDSIGNDAYNGVDLFENTAPLSGYEAAAPKAGSVDLGDPRDSGVEINSLIGDASKIWRAMK
tara:strand:- start:2214 stop:2645 length:432 start_codon:yes stop_codon:yes gene_type:complete